MKKINYWAFIYRFPPNPQGGKHWKYWKIIVLMIQFYSIFKLKESKLNDLTIVPPWGLGGKSPNKDQSPNSQK